MNSEDSFQQLVTQLREGQDEAATKLFANYTHRLIGLVSKRLDRAIQGKVNGLRRATKARSANTSTRTKHRHSAARCRHLAGSLALWNSPSR